MPEILINVVNKIPQLTGNVRQITSGNGDYTVRLVFDDDWADGEKTVLFVRENGFAYPAVRTENDCCAVPEVNGVPLREWLYVGVKQGGVYTSRPCGIAVYRSIDDMISDEAVQPDPSLWDDILARLIAVEEGINDTVRDAVGDYLDENPVEDALVVTVTSTGSGADRTDVADHTCAEIAAAIEQKRAVRLYRYGEAFTTHRLYNGSCIFYAASPSGVTMITIASSDKVYTVFVPLDKPMTGATGTESGTAGAVPAPAAGQQDMVLHGDGTWRGIEIPETPESVPPGNLTIVVMGESLDELTIVSVQYPADAPEGYQPEDSIAAGNVVVMLALVDQNGEDITALSMGVLNAVDNGVIQSHMNLVRDDAVTSLVLMVDISAMTARAEVFTEFSGGGNSSVATGWTEILPETTAVNDDPNAVLVGFPPIDVSVGDVCRVYYQGNNYSAEAVVTAVEGELAGEPALILSNINPDEVNGSGFVIYAASGLSTIAGDRRGSASITLRIEKRGDCVGWEEFDALSAEVAGKVGTQELNSAVQDALAQAKESGEFDGEPGRPGTTPHIGANGNWYIGDTDTGVKAQGKPGDDYVLTEADKAEIAQEAAGLIDAALLSIVGEVE